MDTKPKMRFIIAGALGISLIIIWAVLAIIDHRIFNVSEPTNKNPKNLIEAYGSFDIPANVEAMDAILSHRNQNGFPLVTEEEAEFIKLLRREYHLKIGLLEAERSFELQREIVDVFFKNGGANYLAENGLAESFASLFFSLRRPDLFSDLIQFIERPDQIEHVGSTMDRIALHGESNEFFSNSLILNFETNDPDYWKTMGRSVNRVATSRLASPTMRRWCVFANYSLKITHELGGFEESRGIFTELFAKLNITSLEGLEAYVEQCGPPTPPL